jgi:hypothetical protein
MMNARESLSLHRNEPSSVIFLIRRPFCLRLFCNGRPSLKSLFCARPQIQSGGSFSNYKITLFCIHHCVIISRMSQARHRIMARPFTNKHLLMDWCQRGQYLHPDTTLQSQSKERKCK